MEYIYTLPDGTQVNTKREVQKALGRGAKAVNSLIKKGIVKRIIK